MIEIISIHIPKTAGRSFLEVLRSAYGPGQTEHFDKKNITDKSTPGFSQFVSRLRPEVKVIHGHFYCSEALGAGIAGKAKFITWLRNPVERVISNYGFFKKRILENPDNPEMRRRANETLMEYATMENSRNRMSKFIAGMKIEDFFFAGIVENFNEDVEALAAMLNWKSIAAPRINDNSAFKSQLPIVSGRELEIIEELNSDDMALYSKGVRIRNNRIA